MSDSESRYEDAKRDDWHDAHGHEVDQHCKGCGEPTLQLVEKYSATRLEPGCELWQCPCGHEEGG